MNKIPKLSNFHVFFRSEYNLINSYKINKLQKHVDMF